LHFIQFLLQYENISKGLTMKNAFCKVQIDFDALLYNYRQIKNLHSELMPVIKADAYAHGAIKIARFFENQDVKYFATGTIHEALELRKNGVTKEIIPLLGALTDEEYKQGNEQDIVSLAHDKQSLEKALAYSEKIAVKINSGMGRLGFLPQDIDTVIMKLKKHNKTASYALTHYASADIISDHGYMQTQTEKLTPAVTALKNAFPDMKTSFANSAALIAYPDSIGDIARIGKIFYGGNPLYGTEKEHLTPHLKPALSLTAPILSINHLKRGESLSYMQSFTAERDTDVAWIGIGYANGYRRSNRVYSEDSNFVPHVSLLGHLCPTLGYITMQMTAIDITDIYDGKNINIGDRAYILGGEENPVTPEMLATWWNTIPHEVLTSLGF